MFQFLILFFHDFSFSESSYQNSVVSVLFDADTTMTFYLDETTFSKCRGFERTFFNINEITRISFAKICIYVCHTTEFGAILYLETLFFL